LRSAKVLLLIALLLSITTAIVILPEPVTAQESNYLEPGDEITGTLSLDHKSDYYGLTIAETGMYRLTINSTGDALLSASISRYSSGSAYPIIQCVSNRSYSFSVNPCSMYHGSIYQVSVQIESFLEDVTSNYTISIERMDSIEIAVEQVYTFMGDEATGTHLILDVEDSSTAYEFHFNSTYSFFYLTIYDSTGLRVFSKSTSTSYPPDYPVLLDPDEYHIFISTSRSTTQECTLQIIPADIPVLTNGDSVELVFSAGLPSYQFAQISITEGAQHSISLDPLGDIDVGFEIWNPPYYGPTFNYWYTGETESVIDLTFWEKYIAYTELALNPDNESTFSRPRLSSFSSSYTRPDSFVLLYCYHFGFGNATLSLDIGPEAPIISPDVPISTHFDGGYGPFWKLYKMTGFSSMNLYEFHLEHFPTTNDILEPTYRIYSPYTSSQSYLFRTRPFLTELEQESWDQSSTYSVSLQYEQSQQTNDAYYYQSNDDERWLYIYIPDGYYNEHYPSFGVSSGDIQLVASVVDPIYVSITEPISVVPPLPETSIFYLQLEGNYVYQIEISATDLQSSGYLTLWNATGHQLADSQDYTSERFSRTYLVEVETTGQHTMLVTAKGDSPVIVEITKMQDVNAGIQLPFMIGSLGVAVAEGIIVGVIIGKVKFGKDSAG